LDNLSYGQILFEGKIINELRRGKGREFQEWVGIFME
jgi:hypothetical protein